MTNCIFCKIVKKELPAAVVYKNENALAFKDIDPKAPVHILIVSKKHVASLNDATPKDKELLGELLFTAKKIAAKQKIKSYKIVINVGRDAGQSVDHLHIHLLSGRPIELP